MWQARSSLPDNQLYQGRSYQGPRKFKVSYFLMDDFASLYSKMVDWLEEEFLDKKYRSHVSRNFQYYINEHCQ